MVSLFFCLLNNYHYLSCSVRNRSIAWLLVLHLADFLFTAHPNIFTLNTSVHWGLSKTPVKCEIDWVNGCREIGGWTDSFGYSSMISCCVIFRDVKRLINCYRDLSHSIGELTHE